MSALKRKLSIDVEKGRAAKRVLSLATSKFRRTTGVNMKRFNTTLITRSVIQSSDVNESIGWNSVGVGGRDITIAPTLATCDFIVSGVTLYSTALPNISELVNLYDQYRIKKVHVEVFYSNNSSTLHNPTLGLPLIHVANDYNSVGAYNLADIAQYPDMKTYQLGNNKRIKWSFVPRVRADVLTNSGVLSSSALNTTGWIDTSSSTVQHLGTRVYMNFQNLNTNVSIGTMTFVVSYDIECRLVK